MSWLLSLGVVTSCCRTLFRSRTSCQLLCRLLLSMSWLDRPPTSLHSCLIDWKSAANTMTILFANQHSDAVKVHLVPSKWFEGWWPTQVLDLSARYSQLVSWYLAVSRVHALPIKVNKQRHVKAMINNMDATMLTLSRQTRQYKNQKY